jgi:type IV pilus biogenesis protein CpaD/CtpE
MRIFPVFPLLFVLAGTLTACSHNFDSIARLNAVPLGGTNEANIAAMVANPADLVRGRGQDTTDGGTAAQPIQRLLTDRPKPLYKPAPTGAGAAGG